MYNIKEIKIISVVHRLRCNVIELTIFKRTFGVLEWGFRQRILESANLSFTLWILPLGFVKFKGKGAGGLGLIPCIIVVVIGIDLGAGLPVAMEGLRFNCLT